MNVSFSDVLELEDHLAYIKEAINAQRKRKEGNINYLERVFGQQPDISSPS